MSTKKVAFEIELPKNVKTLGELNQQAKEAFVLDLLRQKEISQGRAAELLKVDRWKLAELMQQHQVLGSVLNKKQLNQGLSNLKQTLEE